MGLPAVDWDRLQQTATTGAASTATDWDCQQQQEQQQDHHTGTDNSTLPPRFSAWVAGPPMVTL